MYTKPNHETATPKQPPLCHSRLAIMATPVAKQLETVRLKRVQAVKPCGGFLSHGGTPFINGWFTMVNYMDNP